MLIRPAEPARDAAACAAIYAPFVRDTAVSFEEVPPGAAAMAERMITLTQTYPWLIADDDGAAAGYAYASRHKERAAYRWAVEVTAYVEESYRRQGVGRALYEALLGLLRRQGFRTACAGITLPNPASVALHEACGFRLVGVYERIGFKAGAWRDVSWWQCALGPADEAEPSAPGPPLHVPHPGAPGPGSAGRP